MCFNVKAFFFRFQSNTSLSKSNEDLLAMMINVLDRLATVFSKKQDEMRFGMFMPEPEDDANPSSPHHQFLLKEHSFRVVFYEKAKGESRAPGQVIQVPSDQMREDLLFGYLLNKINAATQEAPVSASFNGFHLLNAENFDDFVLPSHHTMVFFIRLDMSDPSLLPKKKKYQLEFHSLLTSPFFLFIVFFFFFPFLILIFRSLIDWFCFFWNFQK